MQTLVEILNVNTASDTLNLNIRLIFEKGFNDLNLSNSKKTLFFNKFFFERFSHDQDLIHPKLLESLIKHYNTNNVSQYCLIRALIWLTVPAVLGRYSEEITYVVGEPKELVDQIRKEFSSAFTDLVAERHVEHVFGSPRTIDSLVDELHPDAIPHWYTQKQDCATSNGNCEFSEIMAILWLTTPKVIAKNSSLLVCEDTLFSPKKSSFVDKLASTLISN